jgi:hypothetical protein
MRIYAKKIVFIVSVILISYVAYIAFAAWQDERLSSKTKRIRSGMRMDDIIEILGKPKYEGLIDSSELREGWDSAFRANYEEVRKKYDKLLFYNYHTRRYKIPSFHERNGGVNINVYFDAVDRKVVYVSRFIAVEHND